LPTTSLPLRLLLYLLELPTTRIEAAMVMPPYTVARVVARRIWWHIERDRT
jgi:hypothetical protein